MQKKEILKEVIEIEEENPRALVCFSWARKICNQLGLKIKEPFQKGDLFYTEIEYRNHKEYLIIFEHGKGSRILWYPREEPEKWAIEVDKFLVLVIEFITGKIIDWEKYLGNFRRALFIVSESRIIFEEYFEKTSLKNY